MENQVDALQHPAVPPLATHKDLKAEPTRIKFSIKRVLLITLINAALQVLWMVYNSYIPLYLQGGNASALGNAAGNIPGFGLNPGLTGFIMTLDNILALLVGPFIGMLSDASRSKLGRRMPFLLLPMPFMVVALVAIGFIPTLIPANLSGHTAQLGSLFVPFFIALAAVLLGNAFMDTPKSALLLDWTPSEKRTTANGIAALVATVIIVIVLLMSSTLFEIFKPLPFLLSGGVLLISVLLVFFFVKDAPAPAADGEESLSIQKILAVIRNLPRDHSRSLVFFTLAMFSAYLGIALIQAFLTSYAVSVVGMDAGTAGMLLAIFAVGGAIMALPAAWLAEKFGRKRMTIAGFAIMIGISVATALIPNPTFLMIAMVVIAIGWISANVCQLPMMADHAPSDTYLGTFISLLTVIITISNIVAPIIGGWLVQFSQNNYALIWPMTAVVFAVAIFLMFPVTRGEARK